LPGFLGNFAHMSTQTRIALYSIGFLVGALITAFLFVHRSGLRDERGSQEYRESWTTLPLGTRDLPAEWREKLPEVEVRQLAVRLALDDEASIYAWLLAQRNPIRLYRLIEDLNQPEAERFNLVAADRIEVVGLAGQEAELLRSGLDNTGYPIIEHRPAERLFVVGIDPFPADSMARHLHFLNSRHYFVEEARPLQVDPESLD